MTDQSSFLETEAVVNSLLEELTRIKSASEQLEKAGSVAQQVAETSQNITEMTGQVLEHSSRHLKNSEDLSRKVNQKFGEFKDSQVEVAARIQALETAQAARFHEMSQVISQNTEKLGSSLDSLGNATTKTQRILVFLGIGVILNTLLGIILVVLYLIGS